MKISRIRLADTEADFDEARALGRSWVDWQLKVYPELQEPILAFFDPVETISDTYTGDTPLTACLTPDTLFSF